MHWIFRYLSCLLVLGSLSCFALDSEAAGVSAQDRAAQSSSRAVGSADGSAGIEQNKAFKLVGRDGEPVFKLNGEKQLHQAVVRVGNDGVAVMVIQYLSADGQWFDSVTYILTRQDGPDPTPPIPPDPVPPPNTKWQVCFFCESNELDDGKLTQDQVDMLVGLKYRTDLKASGHLFKGSLDPNSCTTGSCNVVSKALRPWFQSFVKQKVKAPCVGLAPITGGAIKFYPLPKTKAEMSKLLGGGK